MADDVAPEVHEPGGLVRVLLDRDDLIAFQHPCAVGLGAFAQDRLEARLGDEQPPARA